MSNPTPPPELPQSDQTVDRYGQGPVTHPTTTIAPAVASRPALLASLIRREFLAYFRSPVAYVFLAVFLLSSIGLTWFIGSFFESNDASMSRFFSFLPWVYLFLIPAVGMRLWSEERRAGTWELLFTYPLNVIDTVAGKFLAGWAFIGVALLLTWTMPATLVYLGHPDWGPVMSGYVGGFLMAGAYLGICALSSALTRNQVISFVLGFMLCLVLVLLGWSVFNNIMVSAGFPVWLVDFLANMSFIPHFDPMTKGLLTLGDVFFFLSFIIVSLALNALVLER